MKYLALIVLLLFIAVPAASSQRDQEKYAIKQLLDEREAKFGEYARAAAARSGFFGNKSKKDLKQQMEVLTEIIKTDNRIISLLNNFLEHRTFQRTEMIYNQGELDERVQRLDDITDVQAEKLAAAKAENEDLRVSAKWAWLLNWILLAVIALTTYYHWKRRQ